MQFGSVDLVLKYVKAEILVGVVALLVLFGCASPSVASAATCTDTWTGPAEGNWTTAESWSAGHSPTSTDVACIGSGKTVKVTTLSRQAALVQGEGTLDVAAGSLELLSTETYTISTLKIGGGELKIDGTQDVSTALSLEAGTLGGTGTTVIGASASAALSTTSSSVLSGVLVNDGTTTLETHELFNIGEGAKFENVGTFKFTSAARINGYSGQLINTGTMEQISGTSESELNVPFENHGTLDVAAGKLLLLCGGSSNSSGHWEAAEGSELKLTGNVHCEATKYLFNASVLSGHIELKHSEYDAMVYFEDVNAEAATLEDLSSFFYVEGGTSTVRSLTLSHRGIGETGRVEGNRHARLEQIALMGCR